MNAAVDPLVGLVVIGRNEGERLKRCLRSSAEVAGAVVYVDSGSTDGSVEWACGVGADVVALDMDKPFTAARARNAGLRRLGELQPDAALVQFVDGDCELAKGWLSGAVDFMSRHPKVAAVCGRLRERHPEASVYNHLCDIEWNAPVGQVLACGGIVMMRLQAMLAVGGFDESLIAGEEPELCVRLRAGGWQVWRLDFEMASHDAAMTRFSQWWRRARRAGHAFAQGCAMHGAAPERHYVVETRRAVLWGVILPVLTLLALTRSPMGGLLALAYPLQFVRLGWLRTVRGEPIPWTQSFFLVVGRLPEALGVLGYWWSRLRRTPARLIEYK